MCKIQIPTIPSTATADERRTIMFKALRALNLNDMCEKRGELTYLPWSDCMDVLRSAFPSATYRVIKNSEGLPYFTDPDTGIMVFTEITIDGVTSECFLPVMDNKNQAMKLVPYTYNVWNSYKKCNEERNVAAATMFDINKTIWRCLVKNIAIATGIGYTSSKVRMYQRIAQTTHALHNQHRPLHASPQYTINMPVSSRLSIQRKT